MLENYTRQTCYLLLSNHFQEVHGQLQNFCFFHLLEILVILRREKSNVNKTVGEIIFWSEYLGVKLTLK